MIEVEELGIENLEKGENVDGKGLEGEGSK